MLLMMMTAGWLSDWLCEWCGEAMSDAIRALITSLSLVLVNITCIFYIGTGFMCNLNQVNGGNGSLTCFYYVVVVYLENVRIQ